MTSVDDRCPICLDDLRNNEPISVIIHNVNKKDDEEVKVVAHMFHKKCLEENMKSEGSGEDVQHKCPLCNFIFDESNVYTMNPSKPAIPDDVIRDYINDLREVFDVNCDTDLEDLKAQYGDRYEINDEVLKRKCNEILNQAGGKKKSRKSKKSKKSRKSKKSKKSRRY